MNRTPSVARDSTHAGALPAGVGLAAGSLAALVAALAWWLVAGGGRPGPVSVSLPSLVLVATVFLVAGRRSLAGAARASSTTTAPGATLAVLPFVDWGAPDDRELFGAAVAACVRERLSAHTAVRGGPSGATGARLGPPGSARRIGRALGVSALLEGSVLRADDRSRVTAQLVETQTGFRIWSGTYAFPHEADADEVASLIVGRMLASAACRRRLSAPDPSTWQAPTAESGD